jgi:hypothetical protein
VGIVWNVWVCSYMGFSTLHAVYAKPICCNWKLYVRASSNVTEPIVCLQTENECFKLCVHTFATGLATDW